MNLPAIPGVRLEIEDDGGFPLLIVTAPRAAIKEDIVRAAHAAAGENGAGIEFRVAD